ncbi:uncharacterized protein SPPG_07271 [Spizellomyces punctatus DAOM BR117]|uniref:Restriction endonuclease domain-containing protein n=1 Tax=Spizellomyces punctatus (strain DAOM BR117) TaxID=645134 RepID=A0A0L0H9L4_SPIPD|nr:uncharacterized protein SPPG_07271 [Spizellomyces punctatus DAOM BR117]KNC97343.1 hypothetical protein SPPG_07271 [Spizellomyces punctatus DAOM BR117]|eukprot:XP_016605383.1 hypothetical protein SPPG_07271 [Spizellomyces punctatus DAOM BR117]
MITSEDEQLRQVVKNAIKTEMSSTQFWKVAEHVPENEFLELAQSNFKECMLDYDHGTVRIRRVPSFPHERAATSTFNQIAISLIDKVGTTNFDSLCNNIGTTTLKVNSQVYKQPDAGFVPVGRMYPTVLIEVGWSEALKELQDDARTWLTSHIDIACVILIDIQRIASATLGRRMSMEIWMSELIPGRREATQVSVHPFGENIDLEKALPPSIPFHILFKGVPAPEGLDLEHDQCTFDLVALRDKIKQAIIFEDQQAGRRSI